MMSRTSMVGASSNGVQFQVTEAITKRFAYSSRLWLSNSVVKEMSETNVTDDVHHDSAIQSSMLRPLEA